MITESTYYNNCVCLFSIYNFYNSKKFLSAVKRMGNNYNYKKTESFLE